MIPVSDFIKDTIRNKGPISFHDFMDIVLYDPLYGYYQSETERIGTNGDFYTSPCFTPLFGEMIAKQIEEMWILLGKKEFSIIEFGGGSGRLCLDILNTLTGNDELFNLLTYYIIEKSNKSNIDNFPFPKGKVHWLKSSNELTHVTGCVLSNELIDNLPFHRVEAGNGLNEIYVDVKNNEFTEILLKDDGKLQEYLSELNVELPAGFRTEINLDALLWLKEVSRVLEKGFILTIDYGYNNVEFYNKARYEGGYACYYRHNRNFDPFLHPGEQDITAHVNFSALYHWGLKNHLRYTGFTTQHYFLRSLGIADYIKKMEEKGKLYCRSGIELHNLVRRFLSEMSEKFKVLIQQKGIEPVQLGGLKFNLAPGGLL
jgi:SAM-dependent MidA family methyltransferase